MGGIIVRNLSSNAFSNVGMGKGIQHYFLQHLVRMVLLL